MKERNTERGGNKEAKTLLRKSTAVTVTAVSMAAFSAEDGHQNKTKQRLRHTL
jgi:hypothetical protein